MNDNAADAGLPRYRSHKMVRALEIESAPLGHITFKDKRFGALDAPLNMWERYKPVEGDFYVIYEDGYQSFSPRKAFLDGYSPV